MRRLLSLLAVVVLGMATFAGAAFAVAGSQSDPNEVDGPLDVETASHDNDASTIELAITTFENLIVDDVNFIAWKLDFDEDGTPDACIVAEPNDDATAVVAQFEGHDGTDCDATATPDTTVTVTFPNDSDTVTVSASRSDFGDAGMEDGDTSYDYQVEANGFDGEGDDTQDLVPDDVADFITHDLTTSTPTPTPTPTPSSPAPVDTQSQATLSRTSAARGTAVTVSGQGCAPGASAGVLFDSTPVGTAAADGAGAVTTSFTVPSAATAGLHSVTIVCQSSTGGTHRAVGSLTVTAGGLPATGDGSTSMPIGAAVALFGGMFLAGAGTAVTRRRALARR